MLNPRGFVKLLATRAIGQGCKDGQFFFYWIYILLLLDYFSGMKNVDDEKGESRESGLSHFSCYSRSVLRAPSVSILLPSLLFYFSMMTITTFSTKWNGFFEGKKRFNNKILKQIIMVWRALTRPTASSFDGAWLFVGYQINGMRSHFVSLSFHCIIHSM